MPLLILLNVIEDVWIVFSVAKNSPKIFSWGLNVHDQKLMSQALELQNFEVEKSWCLFNLVV